MSWQHWGIRVFWSLYGITKEIHWVGYSLSRKHSLLFSNSLKTYNMHKVPKVILNKNKLWTLPFRIIKNVNSELFIWKNKFMKKYKHYKFMKKCVPIILEYLFIYKFGMSLKKRRWKIVFLEYLFNRCAGPWYKFCRSHPMQQLLFWGKSGNLKCSLSVP